MQMLNFPTLPIQAASCFFGLAAALFWLKAGLIKTPAKISYLSMVRSSDGKEGGMEGPLADIAKGLSEQGRWNGYAAICASIAGLFQVVLLLN